MSLSSWLGPGSSAYVAQGYLQCYAQIVLEYRLLAYWRSNSPIPFSCLLLLWMLDDRLESILAGLQVHEVVPCEWW